MTKGVKMDLRIKPDLLASFKEEAEARGMKLAPWVRLACLNMVQSTKETRDSLATVAMHALWTKPPINLTIQEPEKMFGEISTLAYQFADAMLIARNKRRADEET